MLNAKLPPSLTTLGCNDQWLVWKFGGTSLANAERLAAVAELASAQKFAKPLARSTNSDSSTVLPGEEPLESSLLIPEGLSPGGSRLVIVCSAMAGVTDLLAGLCETARRSFAARSGSDDHRRQLEQVRALHRTAVEGLTARRLLSTDAATEFLSLFERDLQTIAALLDAVSICGVEGGTVRDTVMGHGELWSSRLIRLLLRSDWGATEVCWLDAREVIQLEPPAAEDVAELVECAHVDFTVSGQLLADWVAARPAMRVMVMTGYVCRDFRGAPSTLKRNGSDFSAAIVAALLNAAAVTIWTDVCGVYSCDPRIVPNARRLPLLTYAEAAELAAAGAAVLHPSTMHPCASRGIPIVLRSALEPACPGTVISDRLPPESPNGPIFAQLCKRTMALSPASPPAISKEGVCAFTASGPMCLLTLELPRPLAPRNSGCQIAARLFTALAAAHVSVVLIAQSSGQHSICVGVPEQASAVAAAALTTAFCKEVQVERTLELRLQGGQTMVCAVGEGMAGRLGLVGRLAAALGTANVNVTTLAQDAKEITTTFVVKYGDKNRALRALHDAAFGE